MQLGRRRSAVWAALSPFALLACDDSSGSNEIPPPPTMIVVDPEQFDSAVACVDAPGGMRLYVATLFDVSESDTPSPQLASSPPTPCTTPVGFGYVEPGRKYRAEVDGYDVDNLEALTAGNRLLRQGDTGELVQPRWRASCGNPLPEGSADGGDLDFLQGPAEAFLNASVTVMGCNPFSDANTMPGGTAIRIDLTDALGTLRCGNLPDQVASYQVAMRSSTAAPITASCGEDVTFGSLTANQTYFFDVVAFEGVSAGADGGAVDAGRDAGTASDAAVAAHWSTSCYQRALAGVQQTAICEPLAPIP